MKPHGFQFAENRLQSDQEPPWLRVKDDKDSDVPGGQRLAMKTRRGSSADGIAGDGSVVQEAFEDITDGLHVFLIASSCRVS
jgi:hypothetical protein